jgi:hypothetical protein
MERIMKISRFGFGLIVCICFTYASSFAAFNDNGTEYSNKIGSTFVKDPAAEGLKMVNAFVCIVNNTGGKNRPNNEDGWRALVDEFKCGLAEPEEGATSAKKIADTVMTSTRATDLSMQNTKSWFISGRGTSEETVYVATVGINNSTDSAYGMLMDFKYYASDGNSTHMSTNQVNTATQDHGYATIGVAEMGTTAADSTLDTNPDTVIKVALNNGGGVTGTKAVTYGPSNVQTAFVTKLFNENSGQFEFYRGVTSATEYLSETRNASFASPSTTCYNRDKKWANVYRYGLYDNATGAEVKISGTFNFEYTNSATETKRGSVGYWGAWLEGTDSDYPTSGTDVSIIQSNDNGTTMKLKASPGRLVKISKKDVTITSGERFKIWDHTQSRDVYYRPGNANCGTSGFSTSSSSCSEFAYNGSHWRTSAPFSWTNIQAGERLWAEMSNADVVLKTVGATSTGVAFTRDNVTPSSAAVQSDMAMTCVGHCPKATITKTERANYSFEGRCEADSGTRNTFSSGKNGPSASGCGNYTFKKYGGTDAMTMQKGGSNVLLNFTEATLSDSEKQNHWGFGGGSYVLTSDLTDGSQATCGANDNPSVTENIWNCTNGVYQWQSGFKRWDQYYFAAYDNGTAVQMDQPIPIELTFASSDDRNNVSFDGTGSNVMNYIWKQKDYSDGSYTNTTSTVAPANYNGKVLVANYEGGGELWGLPERRTPAGHLKLVNLKDGTQVTRSDNASQGYVVKSWETGLMFSSKAGGCGTLSMPASGFGSTDIPSTTDVGYPQFTAAEMPNITKISVNHGVELE